MKFVDGDSKTESDNLSGWDIVSVSSYSIEISLQFKEPLMVSQGDEVDQLFMDLRLSEFPDEHGATLPKVILLNK